MRTHKTRSEVRTQQFCSFALPSRVRSISELQRVEVSRVGPSNPTSRDIQRHGVLFYLSLCSLSGSLRLQKTWGEKEAAAAAAAAKSIGTLRRALLASRLYRSSASLLSPSYRPQAAGDPRTARRSLNE